MRRKIDTQRVRVKKTDQKVHAIIDGIPVVTDPGKTIWDAAAENGILIPAICHQDEKMPNTFVDLNPVGVCRLCCVDVAEPDREGKIRSRRSTDPLVPSCMRPIEDGMEIKTHGGDVDVARRTLIELLLADHPQPCERHREFQDCELEVWGEKLGVTTIPFSRRPREAVAANKPNLPASVDKSNASIQIDHAACIVCDRCVRACTDVQHNNVIGRNGKGYKTTIGFDLDVPMGDSSCVNCGECMISCPTGAITYTGEGTKQSTLEPGGIEPTVDMLRAIPIFDGISSAFLERSLKDIRIRHPARGETLCVQGEYGSTAYYVQNGTCDIFIDPGAGKAKAKAGLLRRVVDLLKLTRDDGRATEQSRLAIDATVDLAKNEFGKYVNAVGEGDLVGEMSCMSFLPRSATVVAATDDVEVVEIRRNVVELLRKNQAYRDKIDAAYRRNALRGRLATIDIFKGLPEDFLSSLESRADLLRLRDGQLLFSTGDTADCFYIVRSGHIEVSKSEAWGKVIHSYLGRGQCFGEIALLGNLGLLDKSLPGSDGKRTANCTALDHAEVVKFDQSAFAELVNQFPEAKQRLVKLATERLRNSANVMRRELSPVPSGQNQMLDTFVREGLYQAQSLLILDLENCTRCDECVRACADAHDGITRMVRDGIRFDKYLVATSCRSCYDPMCMRGCPVDAIHRKDGLEVVIENTCIGCGRCAEQCPYGSISLHTKDTAGELVVGTETRESQKAGTHKAAVCDLSSELSEPACVYACPHDAAKRVNAQEFFQRVVLPVVPDKEIVSDRR